MRPGAIEIDALGPIADRFDHVLLDQWGTLHEGGAVFTAARDCVARLKAAGKRVLVLSNSGKRAGSNEERLARLGLPPTAYDGILTSGEVTWTGLRERARAPFKDLGQSCFLVTRGGDHSIIDGLDLSVATDVEQADFILLAGLDDAVAEPERARAPDGCYGARTADAVRQSRPGHVRCHRIDPRARRIGALLRNAGRSRGLCR
ncbi:hypothetical protein ACKWRH_16890 [Bradyrhizobium sp. Pa8]|uniref:hypothetical protein n=1 Tax=Bradyrhizobium sp. Pa8 TaxID=3386552 RepID=UPI00403F63F0